MNFVTGFELGSILFELMKISHLQGKIKKIKKLFNFIGLILAKKHFFTNFFRFSGEFIIF